MAFYKVQNVMELLHVQIKYHIETFPKILFVNLHIHIFIFLFLFFGFFFYQNASFLTNRTRAENILIQIMNFSKKQFLRLKILLQKKFMSFFLYCRLTFKCQYFVISDKYEYLFRNFSRRALPICQKATLFSL